MTHNNYTKSVKESSTPLRAAPYGRVSTSEQATEGVSLDAQLAALKTYVKLKNWAIVDEYVDGGFQGSTDERPALQRLMADARSGRVDVVLVAKMDRFFRNLRLLVNYIGELRELGVTFVSVQEGLDTSTPMGEFTLNILGVIAEFERGRIGERMRDARRHRVSQGQWSSGRTPYGYRFNKTQKALETYEPEAQTVRFIFHTYTTQRIGVIRLAELLNEQGFVTPRMGRRKHLTWQAATVKHILHHGGYGGGPNEQWPFFTPPIVDVDTWQSAQRRLVENRRFQPARHISDYQGKLRCGLCGHTLRIAYSHEYRKWECPGRLKRLHLDGSPRCTLPRFDAGKLEDKLSSELSALFNSPRAFVSFCEQTIANLQNECKEFEARLRPLDAEAKRVREDMAILDARLEMYRINPNDYKARMRDCQNKLQGIERRQVEADPMLLKSLKQNELNVAAYRVLLDGFMDGDPVWLGYEVLNAASESLIGKRIVNIEDDARSIPMVGIVYPDRVELKGSVDIGQSLGSPVCRNDKPLSLPLSVKVDVREAAHSGRW